MLTILNEPVNLHANKCPKNVIFGDITEKSRTLEFFETDLYAFNIQQHDLSASLDDLFDVVIQNIFF